MNQFLELLFENLFEIDTFLMMLFRFSINAFFLWVVIDRIYYRINKQKEYLFTFFIFNILIFFVSSVLSDVKMKTGFAFGLFAIFSILRYRTEQINIKEMTFLFTSIILAVLNSMVTLKVPIANIIFADLVITGAVYYLERIWLKTFNLTMDVVYEKVELIDCSRRKELIEDLKKRTGLSIRHLEVCGINYLRDTADIRIYYE